MHNRSPVPNPLRFRSNYHVFARRFSKPFLHLFSRFLALGGKRKAKISGIVFSSSPNGGIIRLQKKECAKETKESTIRRPGIHSPRHDMEFAVNFAIFLIVQREGKIIRLSTTSIPLGK